MASTRMNLLLLPPPPSDTSLGAFRAAYGPALDSTLARLAGTTPSPILDLCILCDAIPELGSKPRSSHYAYLQQVLCSLYSLLCSVLAERDGEAAVESVEYRVLLLHSNAEAEAETAANRILLPQGPLVSLKALAGSRRPWSDVFGLEGENGEALLHAFVLQRRSLPPSSRLQAFDVHRTAGGTSIRLSPDRLPSAAASVGKAHLSVAVGGTFDHLHAGHKLLLTATALVLEPARRWAEGAERCLTVGITGDELLRNKKHAETLESWEERHASVIRFLSALLDLNAGLEAAERERFAGAGPNGRAVHYKFGGKLTVKCVEISDPFGPTITDATISALVVSGETRSGGKAVNDKRGEKGWEGLEIFEIGVLDARPGQDAGQPADDFAGKISSTAIRKRLLERKGGN